MAPPHIDEDTLFRRDRPGGPLHSATLSPYQEVTCWLLSPSSGGNAVGFESSFSSCTGAEDASRIVI